MPDLHDLTATEAIALIAKGEICASELCESCLAQTERLEPGVRAFAHLDPDLVMRKAKRFDEGSPSGLCGVPFGVKDVFNTAELPTEMGSPIWKGFMPGNDARAVAHLKWAGGVMFGKTVTAEFAVHHPGPTTNPHNQAYSPGTSSSGSAAAVAARMIPLALGTQTAGSTIRPASYCGIYGFKPTFGVVPRTGILKTLDTLDHVCFFARSPEDIRLTFNIARVKGSNHPYAQDGIDHGTTKFQRPIRLAFVKGPVWEHAETYARKAILELAKTWASDKRILLNEVLLPHECYEAHEIHELIYTKALSWNFAKECAEHPELVSQIFMDMAERGWQVKPTQYHWGLEKQCALIKKMDDFFGDYDIILNLSTAREAPLGIHGKDVKDNCLIWTLAHAPALNLPVFKAPSGMPFGAQIVARRYGDIPLLRFAESLRESGLAGEWDA